MAGSDDEWENIGLEPEELAEANAFKPPTIKQSRGWFSFSKQTYEFDSAKDFKDLTPNQILTTELYLINPSLDDGRSSTQKQGLDVNQHAALSRLMSIKKLVEKLPVSIQEKTRLDLIAKFEQGTGTGSSREVKKLLDEARVDLRTDKRNEEYSKARDRELAMRLAKSKSSGGKRTRRGKRTYNRKSKKRTTTRHKKTYRKSIKV
jgi:hypothetical protein